MPLTFETLTQLLPDAVTLHEITLDADAVALAQEVAGRVRLEGMTPIEAVSFVARLFQLLCQDGSPAGLALQPPSTHSPFAPGQRRRLRAGAPLQPRAALDRPLLGVLADCVMYTAAQDCPELVPVLPHAQALLEQVAAILKNLAQEARWSPWLYRRPDGPANRLYDMHWRTSGYPAYRHLAYAMQAGLIAQIRKESRSGKRPETIIHNIRSYLTPAKAIMPLLDPAELLPVLAVLPDDQEPLRQVLRTAASWLVNISGATRADYVAGFLDMILCGAAAREPRHGVSGFGRQRRLHFTEVELDPEIEPMAMPGHVAFSDAVKETACIEDTPASEMLDGGLDALDDSLPSDDEDKATDKHPQRFRRLGNRAAMDRYLDTARPGVFQPRELAEFYAAICSPTDAPTDLARRLNRAGRFLLLDLLIHTGRPAGWLTSLHRGTSHSNTGTLRYVPADGAIYYVPAVQPGIPGRLLGENDKAIREREVHARACEPVVTKHILPLAPIQIALLQQYLDLRARALDALPRQDGLAADNESGPLFLLTARGQLRAWTEDDVHKQLCSSLTSALRSRHPGWPSVRADLFRIAFTAHYLHCGLDPVYALWISEHYYSELEMPATYSRVRVGALASAYVDTQTVFRSELIEEYRRLLPDRGLSGDPLLWIPPAPPELPPRSDEVAFGSWHYPRLDRARPLISALRSAAAAKRNYRVALTAVLLTALAGLRPAEVCNLRAHWLDLGKGLLAVNGKANFAWAADRLVPAPAQPLLKAALDEVLEGPQPANGGGLYLLWQEMEGVPIRLSPSSVDQMLVEAGEDAGLIETQVPDWYSFRHLWRSTGLEMGIPFDLLNALAGHQVLGRNLYNPAVDSNPLAALEHGRALARGVMQILEYGGNDG